MVYVCFFFLIFRFWKKELAGREKKNLFPAYFHFLWIRFFKHLDSDPIALDLLRNIKQIDLGWNVINALPTTTQQFVYILHVQWYAWLRFSFLWWHWNSTTTSECPIKKIVPQQLSTAIIQLKNWVWKKKKPNININVTKFNLLLKQIFFAFKLNAFPLLRVLRKITLNHMVMFCLVATRKKTTDKGTKRTEQLPLSIHNIRQYKSINTTIWHIPSDTRFQDCGNKNFHRFFRNFFYNCCRHKTNSVKIGILLFLKKK